MTYQQGFVKKSFEHDSLEKMRHDLRDTTGKIEIKMKEVLETLSSQTTTVEKSADEGWLLKRATHR